MTIIAAVFKDGFGVIGADRQISWGHVHQEGGPKLFRLGAAVFGLTGSARYQRIVRDAAPLVEPASGLTSAIVEAWLDQIVHDVRAVDSNRGHGKVDSDGDRMHNFGGVVLTPVGIWAVDLDGACTHIPSGMWAHGSGREVALGSLWTTRPEQSKPSKSKWTDRDRVLVACEAACALTAYCGGSVDLITIPEQE